LRSLRDVSTLAAALTMSLAVMAFAQSMTDAIFGQVEAARR